MLRSIVFTDLPFGSIADQTVRVPYTGSRVVRLSFFKMVLRYCQEFEVIAIVEDDQKRSVAAFVESAGRKQSSYRLVTPQEFLRMPPGPDTILHSMNADLTRGMFLRSYVNKHNWPVIGLTHDLSDPDVYKHILLAFCGGVQPHDAIFCCSRAAAHVVEAQVAAARGLLANHKASPQLPVLSYGIDADAIAEVRLPRLEARKVSALDDDDFVFLFFGRLCGTTKADLLSLVSAFHRVFLGRSDVKLVLAGSVLGQSSVAYVQDIKSAVGTMGLSEQVAVVADPTDAEKNNLFSAANVFVSPANSLQESFGIVLLEAMAYGLPVIASNWNGYRDIVVDGETGNLFDTQLPSAFMDSSLDPLQTSFQEWSSALDAIGNAIRLDTGALARWLALQELDRERGEAMGMAGLSRVRKVFNWKDILAEHKSTWLHLMKTSKGSSVNLSARALFSDFRDLFKGHPSLSSQSDLL